MNLIYKNHYGRGDVERYLTDEYIITINYSTGSFMVVEELNFPFGRVKEGWGYRSGSIEEIAERNIKRLKSFTDKNNEYSSVYHPYFSTGSFYV